MISTFKPSLFEYACSKYPHHTETSQPTHAANQKLMETLEIDKMITITIKITMT